MPSRDSSAVIVARYLKTNNFTESYEAFIREAGLSFDDGNTRKGDLTLETLLEEKKTFDIAVRFEKLGIEECDSSWTVPAPSIAQEIRTLPTISNVLSAQVENVVDDDGSSQPILFVSTADKLLHLLNARTMELRVSLSNLHDAPILSSLVCGKDRILTASISGQLHLSDCNGGVIEKRRDHSKYVVQIARGKDEHGATMIATAGWDAKINIYRPRTESEYRLGEPVATISLPTKPEAVLFLRHPDNNRPVLLVSRTDSSFIFYYSLDEDQPRLLGKQNLAPHSNAWVAFTPSALELCPTDSTLLAVGTSSIPHMKLLIVKLLVPPFGSEAAVSSSAPLSSLRASLLDEGPAIETQASQARAALAVADREAAAIQIHCTTMAPQTAYSTPNVAWRPNGSGVWVNGDDGAVRGIEASSGKVISTLKGHEAGSKVRCLWAGHLHGNDREKEILVSGGFDQKLIVWNT